jgi:hypothetical protein
MSTKGDPRLLAEEVTKRGEVFRGVESGERELFHSLPRLCPPVIVISHGFGLEGSFLPPPPRSCPSGTSKPPPLLSCLLPFIVRTIGLPPHHILRQGDPPWGAACIPKILHKNAYALRKQKLTQSDKNKLELLHPGTDDPSP